MLRKKQTRIEHPKKEKVSQNPTVRFEATIHAGPKASAGKIDHLDIDRVPGPKGQLRALVTADECVELLDQGFEVRLHHAHPVRPLDPALIATDESVRRLLDEKLRSLTRSKGPKKSKKGERT